MKETNKHTVKKGGEHVLFCEYFLIISKCKIPQLTFLMPLNDYEGKAGNNMQLDSRCNDLHTHTLISLGRGEENVMRITSTGNFCNTIIIQGNVYSMLQEDDDVLLTPVHDTLCVHVIDCFQDLLAQLGCIPLRV